MSIACRPRYQPSGADDNAVLHNNVATSAGGAGATRTSRRAAGDKGRGVRRATRRAVAQRVAGGRQSLPTANQVANAPVTSRRSRISRAKRRNFQDAENLRQLMNLCERRRANERYH